MDVDVNIKGYSLALVNCGKFSGIKISDRLWPIEIFKMSKDMFDFYKKNRNNTYDIENDWIDKAGIYLILWTEDVSNRAIYVGQADNLLNRLQSKHPHVKDWDKWSEVIIITTETNVWGATDLNYLENRFYNIANDASRYNLRNNTEPKSGNKNALKGDISKLEAFVQDIVPILDNIGCNAFVRTEPILVQETIKPISEQVDKNDSLLAQKTLFELADSSLPKKEPVLHSEKNSPAVRKNIPRKKGNWIHIGDNNKKYDAYGRAINSDGEYIIAKNSRICPTLAPSVSKNIKVLREQNKDKINSDYILIEDVICPSPSAAAKFVTGQNRHNIWKQKGEQNLI